MHSVSLGIRYPSSLPNTKLEYRAYYSFYKTLTIGVLAEMFRKILPIVVLLIFSAACAPAGSTSRQTQTSTPILWTPEVAAPITPSATVPSPSATHTSSPVSSPTTAAATETATVAASPTSDATQTEEPTLNSENGPAITADHTVLDQFDQIPDDYIRQAASLRLMFRGSSIAHNINMGLDCLEGNFPNRRPNSCSDFYNLKYDRSNWDFPVRGNPGWIDKVNDFVDLVNQNADQYDVFMFLVDYADGIDNASYPKISDPDNFQTLFVDKIEALQAEHPDKLIIWTTMSMARTGFDNETSFNQMLRAYAAEHNKILFDLADIESHSPDGQPQTDGQGREILYSGYTNEAQSGHLNEVGQERVARSLWWFMARLAGWEGVQP
jgi:hypothetical protein